MMTSKERTSTVRSYVSKYKVLSNVSSTALWRKQKGVWLRVPTYENMFDIIDDIHKKDLGHAKHLRKNKCEINRKWYGMPLSAIEVYLSLCPNCIAGKRPSKKLKMNPLKMIFSEFVGSRYQVDLIDMQSQEQNGYKYILRMVDHLSGYGFVACQKSKSSAETASSLIQILSISIDPKILQSDNGSEFLGE